VHLDWSTILLEIVNFLVLVWILKRFLYRPVMDIVSRRRKEIAASVEAADARLAEANQLMERYEGRIADWQRERAKAREELNVELDAVRQQQLQQLQEEIQGERERARVADERRLAETRRHAEQLAVTQAARFGARLIGQLTGPEIDQRLLDLLVQELGTLPADRAEQWRRQLRGDTGKGEILSARRLSEPDRKRIGGALASLFGAGIEYQFGEDARLIAGVRITIGPWVLRANLQDDLQAFSEMTHEAGMD